MLTTTGKFTSKMCTAPIVPTNAVRSLRQQGTVISVVPVAQCAVMRSVVIPMRQFVPMLVTLVQVVTKYIIADPQSPRRNQQ